MTHSYFNVYEKVLDDPDNPSQGFQLIPVKTYRTLDEANGYLDDAAGDDVMHEVREEGHAACPVTRRPWSKDQARERAAKFLDGS